MSVIEILNDSLGEVTFEELGEDIQFPKMPVTYNKPRYTKKTVAKGTELQAFWEYYVKDGNGARLERNEYGIDAWVGRTYDDQLFRVSYRHSVDLDNPPDDKWEVVVVKGDMEDIFDKGYYATAKEHLLSQQVFTYLIHVLSKCPLDDYQAACDYWKEELFPAAKKFGLKSFF